MPDYEQAPVLGVEYPRAHTIVIENRYNVTPTITFYMEMLTLLSDGRTLTQALPAVASAFDPATGIPLLDPATGEATGESVSQAHLYQVLFSLCEQYRQPQLLETLPDP